MLKRLIQWIKSLFKDQTSVVTGAPLTQSPSQPTKVLGLDTEAGWNAWRDSHVPTTRSYIPTWDKKARIDQLIAASQGPGVDRSGFELNEQNGYLVHPTLLNGEFYTFTLGKPGTVRVFGVSGNEIYKLNGQDVIKEGSIPNQSGTVTFAVVSANPGVPVGVQVV